MGSLDRTGRTDRRWWLAILFLVLAYHKEVIVTASESKGFGLDTLDLTESDSLDSADEKLVRDSQMYGFADGGADDALSAQTKADAAADSAFTASLEHDASVLESDIGGSGSGGVDVFSAHPHIGSVDLVENPVVADIDATDNAVKEDYDELSQDYGDGDRDSDDLAVDVAPRHTHHPRHHRRERHRSSHRGGGRRVEREDEADDDDDANAWSRGEGGDSDMEDGAEDGEDTDGLDGHHPDLSDLDPPRHHHRDLSDLGEEAAERHRHKRHASHHHAQHHHHRRRHVRHHARRGELHDNKRRHHANTASPGAFDNNTEQPSPAKPRHQRHKAHIRDVEATSEISMGEDKQEDGNNEEPDILKIDWSDALETQYKFEHSLAAERGNGPTLVGKVLSTSWDVPVVNRDTVENAYVFRQGEGLSALSVLDGAYCSRESCVYTIMMTFALSKTGGYRKIIDFQSNAVSDAGLYVKDEKVAFLSSGATAADVEGGKHDIKAVTGEKSVILPDRVVHLSIAREENKRVTVYCEDEVQISFVDKWDAAVPVNGTFQFFLDTHFKSKNSAGFVENLRIYRKYLTIQQIIKAGNIETQDPSALGEQAIKKKESDKVYHTRMLSDFYFSNPMQSTLRGSPNLMVEFGEPGAFDPMLVDGEEASVLHVANDTCVLVPNFLENLTGPYSVVVLFALESTKGYRKIMDWNRVDSTGRLSDAGLYTFNGRVKFFYNTKHSITSRYGVVGQSGFHQLVFTKNSKRKVSVYVDGTLQMSWVDKEGYTVPSTGFVRLFANATVVDMDREDITAERSAVRIVEDAKDKGEGFIPTNPQGLTQTAVARLRLYRRALRQDEIPWLTRMHPHKGAHTAVHPGLVGDYWFMDPLASGINGATLLKAPNRTGISLGYESIQKGRWADVMRFEEGAPLVLDHAVPLKHRSEYTVAVLFQMSNTIGKRCIIHFKDKKVEDTTAPLGLYVNDGHLEFFGNKTRKLQSIESNVDENKFHQVVLARSRAGRVQIFLDGVKVLEFEDPEGFALPNPTTGTLSFFKDTSPRRCSAGSVARIRVAGRAFDWKEAEILDTVFEADEPKEIDEPVNLDALTISLNEAAPKPAPAHHAPKAPPATKAEDAAPPPDPTYAKFHVVSDVMFQGSVADVSGKQSGLECTTNAKYAHAFVPHRGLKVAVWGVASGLHDSNSWVRCEHGKGKKDEDRSFSVVMNTRLGDVSGFHQLFSLGANSTTSTGLYVIDGQLKFVGVVGSGIGTMTLKPHRWSQVVLSRSDVSGLVTIYVDGKLDQQFHDAEGRVHLGRGFVVHMGDDGVLSRLTVYADNIHALRAKELFDERVSRAQVVGPGGCGDWCGKGGGTCHNGECRCQSPAGCSNGAWMV